MEWISPLPRRKTYHMGTKKICLILTALMSLNEALPAAATNNLPLVYPIAVEADAEKEAALGILVVNHIFFLQAFFRHFT